MVSADPLSLDKVVRRVKPSAPSLFPSPRGPKTLQFVLGRSSPDGPRAFFFELRIAIAFIFKNCNTSRAVVAFLTKNATKIHCPSFENSLPVETKR